MSTHPTPKPATKTLYVICHGALATLQTDHNLIVMIPDVGTTHTYRVGTWLNETMIEKGSLQTLENVLSGSASVSNIFNTPVHPNVAARPPFATFVLPRPEKIHSLFQASISKDAFTSDGGAIVPAADLIVPLAPVFEYRYTMPPHLGNIWPVATDNKQGLPDNPLTLHIFAEDEIPLDDGHNGETFNLTCQLLGLNIKLSAQGAKLPLTPGDLPPVPKGMEKRLFEFQPLNRRRASLLSIASAKESGAAIPDPWGSLPSDLGDLGDLYFGQEPPTLPGGAPNPRWHQDWHNPACAHLILGPITVGTQS